MTHTELLLSITIVVLIIVDIIKNHITKKRIKSLIEDASKIRDEQEKLMKENKTLGEFEKAEVVGKFYFYDGVALILKEILEFIG